MALGRRARAEGTDRAGTDGARGAGGLSLREVARRTGRDSRELRQLIDAGVLSSSEDGGSRGFDTVDLAAVASCGRLLDAGLAAADLKPLADLLGEVKSYEMVLEDLATSTEPQAEAEAIRATMRGAFRDLHVYLLARAKTD
jgi:DNA-binding transcriptional MerR regulator